MAVNLYVGNLPYRVTEDDLRELFAAYGEVVSAKVILDRETQRPRGFGFVEMASDDEARQAIENLDQKEFMGRTLKVNTARPRQGGGGEGGFRGGAYL
jgi:RNA recognition motif-containing protein